MIGSSLEAEVKLTLKENLYKKYKDFNFEELLITSNVEVVNDNSIKEEIEAVSFKAIGKKCPICWKIRKNKCERHGILN